MNNERKRRMRLRKEAYDRQAGMCFWCGKPMLWKYEANAATVWDDARVCTADHLVLQAHGGRTTEDNVVAACRRCNNSRHQSFDPAARATLADVWPQQAT